MPRRSNPHSDPSALLDSLVYLLTNFASELASGDLRHKVLALVPAVHKLRDLGASLIPRSVAASGRARILAYLRQYAGRLLDGDELLVVSGIDDWARRVRELRVEQGWPIFSGVAFQQIAEDLESAIDVNAIEEQLGISISEVRSEQYCLLRDQQDRDAAFRWHQLNELRKEDASVKTKILKYLRMNVGKEITGEELMYLAADKSEWARRVRELRTEEGWPVKTRSSGRPDLPVAVYVLEEDRQAPTHDRAIPDDIRVAVLKRDDFRCANPACRWGYSDFREGDPRTLLELHHLFEHHRGGANSVDNLIVLCNVCHDSVHRGSLDPLAWTIT